MRRIPNFMLGFVICFSASWLGAQSNAAPVNAIVTDGQTGEVVPDVNLTFTTIDVPGAQYSLVQGINKAGDMVGYYISSFGEPAHGFLFSGGKFTYFDYPGASGTLAYGINDSGLIVGYAEFNNDSVWLGFKYDGTTFTPISDGNNSATVCLGLNNAGWVVGGDGTVFATKGYELRNGRFATINFPGTYVYGYATGINNLGEVVGYTTPGFYIDAYRYAKGQFQKIDFPGAIQTEAWGINDSGVIVGWYAGTGPGDYVFAMKKGKFISSGYPGAAWTAGYGINAAGEIVGAYSLDDGMTHGFITNPLTVADFPPDE